MSQGLSDKIDKLVIDGVKDLNIFIPDSSIYCLVDYVKRKIKWTVLFSLRETIIDYIDINNLLYTEVGDVLYSLLEYLPDDTKTKTKKPMPKTDISIFLGSAADSTSLDVCTVHHHIDTTEGDIYKVMIYTNRISEIETILNINCSNKLYELFSSNFEFILRKGIYDLSIDVVEDIQEAAYPYHDDM